MEIHEGSALGRLLRDVPADSIVRLEYESRRWAVTITSALGPVTLRVAVADAALADALNAAHMQITGVLDTAGVPTVDYSVFHQAKESESEPDEPVDPHIDR